MSWSCGAELDAYLGNKQNGGQSHKQTNRGVYRVALQQKIDSKRINVRTHSSIKGLNYRNNEKCRYTFVVIFVIYIASIDPEWV